MHGAANVRTAAQVQLAAQVRVAAQDRMAAQVRVAGKRAAVTVEVEVPSLHCVTAQCSAQ